MVTLLLALGCSQIADWRLRRHVAAEQARGEAIVVQIPLPRVSGPGEPSQRGLVIAVSADAVHVLDGAWAATLAPEPLRVLVPRGAPLVWELAAPSASGPLLLEALRERLSERAALRKSADGMSGEYTWRGAYELHADPTLRWGAVARVLYTAGQAEWSEAGLRGETDAGRAVYVHAAPGYGEPGGEAECQQLTVMQDPTGLRARLHPGGGLLILGAEDGPWVELADKAALRQWVATQPGPLCERGVLVPDSRVVWGETLALFAALVEELGVSRPALGLRGDG